jgi:glycosyltransferase involved in cell wall biosynthesis
MAGELPVAGPRCSIVIRANNEEKHIGRLLTGILHQTVPEPEVILVDSGSTDATVAIAAQYPVRIIHINPDEFTFGRSLNLGIAAAHSAQIVIASAHVYPVYPDWLESLLRQFNDPQVALAYGKQRGSSTSRYSEHQVFARWFPDESTPRQAHPFCNNANSAIRRSLWEINPYDETLTGLEDIAWARWAIEAGHVIAYSAEAEVVHVHDETPRQVYNRYRREAMAFKRIYPEERFGMKDFLRLTSGNITSDIWHAARQKQLSSSWTSIFWFRWMQFWGTYQGYRRAGPLTWQLRQTFYYPHGIGARPRPSSRQVEPIRYNDATED